MANKATPEQLRKAADFMEDAEKASAAAAAAEREASNLRHEADAKLAAAESAAGEGRDEIPASSVPHTRLVAGEDVEPRRSAMAIIAIVLAGAALIFALLAGVVAFWKSNDHQVVQTSLDGHGKLINEHSRAIGKLEGRTDANEKASARAQGTADQALSAATAAASAASTCNACCKTCSVAKVVKPAEKPKGKAKREPKTQKCVGGCVPHEEITLNREVPRNDGKCITVLNTGNRVQITKDGNSNRLVARLVGDDAKPIGSPVVYVGQETVSGSCHTDEKKLLSHWEQIRSGLKLPNYCRPIA
jgi:hypothetical protein